MRVPATLPALPYPLDLELARTALALIDIQNDFCSPGGWADLAGLNIHRAASIVPRVGEVLSAARRAGLFVVHTREGHRPDLSDCPANKQRKMRHTGFTYGQEGPKGRLYVRGSWNNEIVDELRPIPGEPVIDKPGKGAFYATDLELVLRDRHVEALVVCGLTTHVCVSSTLREAADRGFDGVLLSDCCQSYEEHFHQGALDVLRMPAALFGWLADSRDFLRLLRTQRAVSGPA
jgi:nicotinamidase-related amidase